MVKNLPPNADIGLIPGRGTKIPHAYRSTKPVSSGVREFTTRVYAPQAKISHDAVKILDATAKTQHR